MDYSLWSMRFIRSIVKMKRMMSKVIINFIIYHLNNQIKNILIMFEAIKECDEYPVNFLKGKFHKNVVGALFSLIVSILQYITWGYTGAYYFFQKSHVTQTLLPASSFKQTPFFSDELSTIRIRLSQQNDTSHNELKYLSILLK